MRQLIFERIALTALVLLFICGDSMALGNRKADSEKRKSVHKNYKVGQSTMMEISNTFGKVHVETWDKKEVKVDIEIIVHASSDDKAQDLLEKISIDIDDGNPTSRLAFRTSISNSRSNRNTSFEINYEVSMPKTNSLELKNSFGDVYLGDLSGEADIHVQYGNFHAGRLTGNSEIKLSFGSGFSEIDALTKGDLNVSYSKLGVEEMGNVDVQSSFSTFESKKAGIMDLVAKYGEVEIGQVDVLEADVNFSGFELGKVTKSLILDIDYGGSLEIGISKSAELIDITSSFGPVNMELESGLNARVEARLSFCDMRYDEDLIDFYKIIKEHTSSEYEGKIGNGNGTQIKIVSKYGNVRIDQ